MFGGTIGTGEILIVLVVALIFLGPKRLPGLGRDLGRGMRDFKRAVSGEDADERHAEDSAKQAAAIAPVPPVVDAAPAPAPAAAPAATPAAAPAVPADDAQ